MIYHEGHGEITRGIQLAPRIWMQRMCAFRRDDTLALNAVII